MVDIMNGPNYPLARGFEMAGWRILAVDGLFGEEHDPSKSSNRSEKFPRCWPELQGQDKRRVAASNTAAEFILGESRLHQPREGTSEGENPTNSLHGHTPTEVGMFKQSTWWDEHYDACMFQEARRNKQCIRHGVEVIRLWLDMRCRHGHHPQEWTPQVSGDVKIWYPSNEEVEYTARLVLHIVYSVSIWACQVSRAKLAIPRRPPVKCMGDWRQWLAIDTRALRGWVMIPVALAMGLGIGEFTEESSQAGRG